MLDRGKYEEIIDAGVLIYLFYHIIYGIVYWQNYNDQIVGWICLVLMLLYMFIICAIDSEREMMKKYFKIEKLPWGYHIK